MCGIVGYVGKCDCVNQILESLKHLEYRGYDSSGIAVFDTEKNDEITIIKKCGKLTKLIEYINNIKKPKGFCGIGHTRWATHGQPSDCNSHPHNQKNVTLVHNGIIENYEELRDFLKEKDYVFKTQTDSEVIAALIDYYYENDPIKAIEKATKKLKGSYSLGILFKNIKNTIFGIKKSSPLIVGVAEKESFLASDIPAIVKYTKNYIVLNENEIAILKKDSMQIVDFDGKEKEKKILTINWDIESAEKNGFPHFMLKEIFEQPKVVERCCSSKLYDGDINFKIENLPDEKIKTIKKIHIIACGTAMHAGLVGKYLIEKFIKIPVEVEVASEFRYKDPILEKDDLVILISQSGETADTLAALKLAKKNKAFTLAIVNIVASSIARQADSVIYTLAGLEISVASTKAYIAQITMLYLLTFKLAKILNKLSKEELKKYCKILSDMPNQMEKVLKLNEEVLKFAKMFYKEKDIFFIGRGLDHYLALESSLKLKELSYIHSEAYAAGELKHGPISLIEKDTKVIALATQPNIFKKTLNNVEEVVARGAKVLLICDETQKIDSSLDVLTLRIPKTLDIFTPLIEIIPLQLFAYNVSVLKNCDVDKPRNLAKSVTVE